MIQILKSALKELSESGTLLLDQDMVTRHPQTVASKAFEEWLISKADQNYLLSERNIKSYLQGSQQQSFVEDLAARDAHASLRNMTGTLKFLDQ